MNIRAESERGFSLIELLVVVAIIGVLAAVGVVGYQGYIDSTKKSVTESNAKAVHQWLVNTKTVRAAGIDTDPSNCGTATLASGASSASAVGATSCFNSYNGSGGIAGAGGPFESFKNPYTSSRDGSEAIHATNAVSAITDGTSDCTDLGSNVALGDVVIRVSGSIDHIDVYYCTKEDTGNKLHKLDQTVSDW